MSRTIDWSALEQAAIDVRTRAYAPFSNYLVGASLLTASGKIVVGCNVENSTYGATICAERSAIVNMVSQGREDLVACVVASRAPNAATPCGVCRQVLAEFAMALPIAAIGVDAQGVVVERSAYDLETLLPHAFRMGRPSA
jgi:cytidine deaminase